MFLEYTYQVTVQISSDTPDWIAYSAEQFLLNKQQIWSGGAYLALLPDSNLMSYKWSNKNNEELSKRMGVQKLRT